MSNLDIREEAAAAGVKLWRIAESLGIADHVLSRRLRHELSDEDKARVREIIRELKEADNGTDKGEPT